MKTNAPLAIITSILSLVLIYALGCYPTVARSVPTNYILLTIFTMCFSYDIAAGVL